MTDYRRTEEELWDEDSVAEEDRRAAVLSAKRPESEPRADGEPVASVARFIAEPELAGAPPDAQAATPGWSLAALSLIANDVVSESETKEARAQPPALPAEARAKEREEPLPSMMLGPAMSTRSDITERVTAIPKTHPLASSIAPGGSAMTVPPVRGAARWQLALAALALLGLGATAALFLQSRGEHHAASATDPAAKDSRVLVEPMEETVIVIEDSPPPVLLSAPEGSLDGTSNALSQRSQPSSIAAKRAVARSQLAALTRAPTTRPTLRVAVGQVQLREHPSGPTIAEGEPGLPERASVIEAMREVSAALEQCVGDEHGVVDVTLTVRGSGAVTHALVEGAFAGSEKGSCVARTLRTARLPPFAQASLRIAYPLRF